MSSGSSVRARLRFACLLFLIGSQPAFSQQPDAGKTTAALASSGFIAPATISEASVALPSVEFTSESGDEEVAARIGFAGDTEQLAIVLRAPINTVRNTNLATLDGLSPRSSLALTYNRLFWKFDPSHERVREACEFFGKPSTCGTSDLPEEQQAAFNARASGYSGHPWILGLSARVGRGDFEWTRLDDLQTQNERHNSWSGSLALGTLRPLGYVGVRYEYQNTYRAADDRDLCVPLDEQGILECSQTATAGPSQAKVSLLRVELRRFMGQGRLAINPIYQHDFKADVDALELPVYFISGKDKKGLTGGLAAGWRSDTRDISFRVFVGATFNQVSF
jgi:hypothetical protein